MKRILVLSFGILIATTLVACTAPPAVDDVVKEDVTISIAQPIPTDFDFDIEFGVMGLGRINTFTNEVTKDLVIDGITTVNIELSDATMEKAYEDFVAMDIMNFPETIETKLGKLITPYETYTVKVKMNGNVNEIVWKYNGDPDYDKANQLLELINYLKQQVMETEEYKALPEASGGYS